MQSLTKILVATAGFGYDGHFLVSLFAAVTNLPQFTWTEVFLDFKEYIRYSGEVE